MKALTIFLLFFVLQAGAENCYESTIQSPSPFKGNNNEIFRLSDGSIWKVIYEYEYMYEYYPDVVICPSENKLLIKGKLLNVEPISLHPVLPSENSINQDEKLIESHIQGEFNGWDGETIFKLDNGEVWQQASYAYMYSYKYHPG